MDFVVRRQLRAIVIKIIEKDDQAFDEIENVVTTPERRRHGFDRVQGAIGPISDKSDVRRPIKISGPFHGAVDVWKELSYVGIEFEIDAPVQLTNPIPAHAASTNGHVRVASNKHRVSLHNISSEIYYQEGIPQMGDVHSWTFHIILKHRLYFGLFLKQPTG